MTMFYVLLVFHYGKFLLDCQGWNKGELLAIQRHLERQGDDTLLVEANSDSDEDIQAAVTKCFGNT